MRRLILTLAALVALSAGLLVAVPQASAGEAPFRIYVSPDGSPRNDGLTPETAVTRLESAEYRLTQHAPDRDVEIRIAPGTYTEGQTVWRTFIPGHSITFLPYSYQYTGTRPSGSLPRFQSDGSAGYWFRAELPNGHPGGDTLLRFYYLDVRGYSSGGLAIVGPRTPQNSGNLIRPVGDGMNRNRIYGMRFEGLGSAHNAASTGYSAVTLWNSSHNDVRNNHFVHLENAAHEAGLMHGVYAAHGTSDNVIRDNSFRYVSGTPVNFRNDSNRNLVHKNRFERTGDTAFYADWSCGSWCADAYDQTLECPSHGNVFSYNRVSSPYSGGRVSLFRRWPGDASYVGPRGCSSDGEAWLRTAGNGR